MSSNMSGEEMNDTFERSPSLDADIGALGFNVMGDRNVSEGTWMLSMILIGSSESVFLSRE